MENFLICGYICTHMYGTISVLTASHLAKSVSTRSPMSFSSSVILTMNVHGATVNTIK